MTLPASAPRTHEEPCAVTEGACVWRWCYCGDECNERFCERCHRVRDPRLLEYPHPGDNTEHDLDY